jgi:large subunit ribosomal protein L10Ae
LDQCKAAGIACVDMDAIKKFNKQGKPIKKWARTFDLLLVSETMNKQVAAQIGKILSSVHKLPLVLAENEQVVKKIQELHYTCKWRMKKVIFSLGCQF